MRITIETDDRRDVRIGAAEIAADMPPIDGGPSPIEHIRRLSGTVATTDAAIGAARPGPYSELPLNPLREGQAAALQATSSGVASSESTTPGGRAPHDPAKASHP
jgi:hypothetical protein